MWALRVYVCTVYDVICYLINSFDLIAHALHTSIVQYAWEEATTVTFQEGNKKNQDKHHNGNWAYKREVDNWSLAANLFVEQRRSYIEKNSDLARFYQYCKKNKQSFQPNNWLSQYFIST